MGLVMINILNLARRTQRCCVHKCMSDSMCVMRPASGHMTAAVEELSFCARVDKQWPWQGGARWLTLAAAKEGVLRVSDVAARQLDAGARGAAGSLGGQLGDEREHRVAAGAGQHMLHLLVLYQGDLIAHLDLRSRTAGRVRTPGEQGCHDAAKWPCRLVHDICML